MYVEIKGSPSTSLGPRMGMEPTSLSRTLKTMESQGLIRREVSVEDKRKVLIFLTSKGVKKRRMVREFLLDFNKMIDDKLSKKAKDSLLNKHATNDFVKKIINLLGKTHGFV